MKNKIYPGTEHNSQSQNASKSGIYIGAKAAEVLHMRLRWHSPHRTDAARYTREARRLESVRSDTFPPFSARGCVRGNIIALAHYQPRHFVLANCVFLARRSPNRSPSVTFPRRPNALCAVRRCSVPFWRCSKGDGLIFALVRGLWFVQCRG